MPSSSSIQTSRYCFTLNNYGPEDLSEICERLRSSSNYFIIGKEIGESGTPHLQCYVEVKGDMVPLCVETFIVTSNFHPKEVFTCNLGVEHPQYPALERRIKIEELL